MFKWIHKAIKNKRIITEIMKITNQESYKNKKDQIFNINEDITLVKRSAFSKMGLQEKMVIADWYSVILPSSLYLANKKCVKRENAERTSPTKPTHFNFDLNTTTFPSPFI